jgi:hypothetical protein|tara:strand:- start:3723 stop:4313 length:591 start_codon:yes stop_codon:yes gene_type:complete
MKFLFTSILITFFSFSVQADDHSHASAEWQIEAYSTAAPSFIGNYATVIGGDGKVLREGSNGWTCSAANARPFPKMGWSSAHEAMPFCLDENAMKFMNGKQDEMTTDGWAWMLHGDVGEDNSKPGVLNKADSAPGQWIESGPHMMLMPMDSDSIKNMSSDFTTGAPYVMMPNTPVAHLMIPLPGYYIYQPESNPKN